MSTVTKQPPERTEVFARLDTPGYRKLKAVAALQGISVSALIENAITRYLEGAVTGDFPKVEGGM